MFGDEVNAKAAATALAAPGAKLITRASRARIDQAHADEAIGVTVEAVAQVIVPPAVHARLDEHGACNATAIHCAEEHLGRSWLCRDWHVSERRLPRVADGLDSPDVYVGINHVETVASGYPATNGEWDSC